MNRISLYIKALIFEHDYVNLPNFGAFILHYRPATCEQGHWTPPARVISFNELLRQDDGVLTSYVARRESISSEQAKKKVEQFVQELKLAIHQESQVEFQGVGYFEKQEDGGVRFQPQASLNFLGDSFGLDRIASSTPYGTKPSVFIDEYMGNQPSVAWKSKVVRKKASAHWALYVLPFFILFGLAGIANWNDWGVEPEEEQTQAYSSLNPIDYLPKATEAPVDDDLTLKEEVVANKPSHILVLGLFSKEQNAYKLEALLDKKGYNAQVEDWKSYKRVYIPAFSEGEGEAISLEIQQLIGERGVLEKTTK